MHVQSSLAWYLSFVTLDSQFHLTVQTSAQGILVSAIVQADDTLDSASKPQSVDSAEQKSAIQQQSMLTFAPAQDLGN